jgi:hypothetical protein
MKGAVMASTNSTLSELDSYPVRLEIEYPAPGSLNRWLLFVKWLLVIPHTFLLFFLNCGMLFALFITWWAILFTGRYPQSLFDLVVGIQAWNLRVQGYATLLVTDRYPPFTTGRPMTGPAIATLVVGIALVAVVWMIYTIAIIAIAVSSVSTPTPIR